MSAEKTAKLALHIEELLHSVVQHVRQSLLENLLEDLLKEVAGASGEGAEDAAEDAEVEEQVLLPLVALRLAARALAVSVLLAEELDWDPEHVAALRAMCRGCFDSLRETMNSVVGPDVPDVFRRAFEDDDPPGADG